MEVEEISNARDFVFVIAPALKSDFHKEYIIALKEFKKLKKSFSKIEDNDKAKKMQPQLE
jgi:hypothetical protein